MASPNFVMIELYHSAPNSIPDDPFLSEDLNDFRVPALTSESRFAKASAISPSRESWLTNTRVFARSGNVLVSTGTGNASSALLSFF